MISIGVVYNNARIALAERGWELVMPVLEEWGARRTEADFPNYEAGSWGPAEADTFIARDGGRWRKP